jgi:hypothetical protein
MDFGCTSERDCVETLLTRTWDGVAGEFTQAAVVDMGIALLITTFLMIGASITPLGNAGGIVLSIAATIFIVFLSRRAWGGCSIQSATSVSQKSGR